ncbi:leucyl aminopeptidase family protein, partial [Francisella tularensis subsp. holarctica]|nr:leucyl aminopeptidase family protein [Francisella tularensis subsp. holarctica]
NLVNIQKVICLVSEDMFGIANLPNQLSQGNYHIEYTDIADLSLYYIGFALGIYKFEKYKYKTQQSKVKLYLPKQYQHILAT